MAVGGASYNELFPIFWNWSIFVGVIVFGWMLHHSLFYRAKDGEVANVDNLKVGEFPLHYHNAKLEAAWIILPTILTIYLTVIIIGPTSDVWEDPAAIGVEGEDYFEIGVTGSQWYWTFDCRELSTDICDVGVDTNTSLTTLILKNNTMYRVDLTSTDVTHSPYFVQWGAKEDAIPGLQTSIWLPIDLTGRFFIDCAEFCGDDHAYMTAILVVHE
jgi:cytochrome c oxidase subunit 2